MASFTNWSKEPKIDYVRAEHAPEERLVAPNLWATLSVHVVASPGSHGALEGGGLSVRSFNTSYFTYLAARPAVPCFHPRETGTSADSSVPRLAGSFLLT